MLQLVMRQRKRQAPDPIVIFGPRSGTSYLNRVLNQHPRHPGEAISTKSVRNGTSDSGNRSSSRAGRRNRHRDEQWDDELLPAMDGRRAWHFPQADGGHNIPISLDSIGSDAVSGLERLQASGGELPSRAEFRLLVARGSPVFPPARGRSLPPNLGRRPLSDLPARRKRTEDLVAVPNDRVGRKEDDALVEAVPAVTMPAEEMRAGLQIWRGLRWKGVE